MHDQDHFRNRSLETMEARFGDNLIQQTIEDKLKTQDTVKVLEIGYGQGRVLLELRKKFPQEEVQLFGINYEDGKPEFPEIRPTEEELREVAVKHNIFKEDEEILFPELHFYDAGKDIRFGNESVDVIISQVAFHYIKDKARTVEEMWRVLKVGGEAFIHIDSLKSFYPDILRNLITPRWAVYDKDGTISLDSFFHRFRMEEYDINIGRCKENPSSTILRMKKSLQDALDLGLEMDEISTINLGRLRDFDDWEKTHAWWGYRSVYTLK